MQEKTAILAATSPKDSGTYHNFLITRKDPENPKKNLFNVVYLYEICKDCRGTEKAADCTHMMDNISKNKNAARRRQTAACYPPNRSANRDQELFGITQTYSKGLVPPELIEDLSKNIEDLRHPARCVYLGIDPGGGGDGKLGIVGVAEQLTEYGQIFTVRLAPATLQ